MTIKQALAVVKALGSTTRLRLRRERSVERSPKSSSPTVPLPDEATQITVLHLGHPSDPKYGSVELMAPAQFEEFRRANTWPKPQRRRSEASD